MKIKYSKHSLVRLRERGIKKSEIEKVIFNPTKIKHDEGNKFKYSRKIDQRIITVILNKQKEVVIVITTYHS